MRIDRHAILLVVALTVPLATCSDDTEPAEEDTTTDTTDRGTVEVRDTESDPDSTESDGVPDESATDITEPDLSVDANDDFIEGDATADASTDPTPEIRPDTPVPCISHTECEDRDLCADGFCISPFILDVVPTTDWVIDPYTTAIEYCPEAPEELREVNPAVSEGFPIEVETPDGPGVQSQAEGTTIWCCGCALTRRRFSLPTLHTENVFLSFYFDSGFIGEIGPWNQPTLSIHLMLGTEALGGIRYAQFPDRYSNCPYENIYTDEKQLRLRLDDLYDGQINGIVVEMGHYACEGTNYVTVGPLEVSR